MLGNKTKRMKLLNFTASQYEIDRWDLVSEQHGMSRASWIRYVLRRESGLRVAKNKALGMD